MCHFLTLVKPRNGTRRSVRGQAAAREAESLSVFSAAVLAAAAAEFLSLLSPSLINENRDDVEQPESKFLVWYEISQKRKKNFMQTAVQTSKLTFYVIVKKYKIKVSN